MYSYSKKYLIWCFYHLLLFKKKLLKLYFNNFKMCFYLTTFFIDITLIN